MVEELTKLQLKRAPAREEDGTGARPEPSTGAEL